MLRSGSRIIGEAAASERLAGAAEAGWEAGWEAYGRIGSG